MRSMKQKEGRKTFMPSWEGTTSVSSTIRGTCVLTRVGCNLTRPPDYSRLLPVMYTYTVDCRPHTYVLTHKSVMYTYILPSHTNLPFVAYGASPNFINTDSPKNLPNQQSASK